MKGIIFDCGLEAVKMLLRPLMKDIKNPPEELIVTDIVLKNGRVLVQVEGEDGADVIRTIQKIEFPSVSEMKSYEVEPPTETDPACLVKIHSYRDDDTVGENMVPVETFMNHAGLSKQTLVMLDLFKQRVCEGLDIDPKDIDRYVTWNRVPVVMGVDLDNCNE